MIVITCGQASTFMLAEIHPCSDPRPAWQPLGTCASYLGAMQSHTPCTMLHAASSPCLDGTVSGCTQVHLTGPGLQASWPPVPCSCYVIALLERTRLHRGSIPLAPCKGRIWRHHRQPLCAPEATRVVPVLAHPHGQVLHGIRSGNMHMYRCAHARGQ